MADFVAATRVQIVCPSGTAALFRATSRIIALLLAEESLKTWGGFTYSLPNPPVFIGYFWNEPEDTVDAEADDEPWWEEDRNVLVLIDVVGLSADDLAPYFTRLRSRVHAIYRDERQAQKAIWITAHPLQVLGVDNAST